MVSKLPLTALIRPTISKFGLHTKLFANQTQFRIYTSTIDNIHIINLMQQNTSVITLETIEQSFEQSMQLAAPPQKPGFSNIILLGPTGSGKSTFAMTLEKKAELKTFIPNFQQRQKKYADRSIRDVEGVIGNSEQSQTQIPKWRTCGLFYIWDTPGFEDTKGQKRKITNTCYLKRMFDITVNPKIFIVVNYSSCLISNARGKLFKETIHMVCEWMKLIQGFQKSLSLVITGSDPKKVEVSDIVQLLKGYISVSEQDQFIKRSEKKLISSILEDRRIILMPSPPDDKDLKTDQYRVYYSGLGDHVAQIAKKATPLPSGQIQAVIDYEILKQMKTSVEIIKTEIWQLSTKYCNVIEKLIQNYSKHNQKHNVFEIVSNLDKFIEKLGQISQLKGIQSIIEQLVSQSNMFQNSSSEYAKQMKEILKEIQKKISKIDLFKVFNLRDQELDNYQIFQKCFLQPVNQNIIKFKKKVENIIKILEKTANQSIYEIYATYIDQLKDTPGYKIWQDAHNCMVSYINKFCIEISNRSVIDFNRWVYQFATAYGGNYQQLEKIQNLLKQIYPLNQKINFDKQESLKKYAQNWMKAETQKMSHLNVQIFAQFSNDETDKMFNASKDIFRNDEIKQLKDKASQLQNEVNKLNKRVKQQRTRLQTELMNKLNKEQMKMKQPKQENYFIGSSQNISPAEMVEQSDYFEGWIKKQNKGLINNLVNKLTILKREQLQDLIKQLAKKQKIKLFCLAFK